MANGFTIVTNRDNTFFTNNKMTVGSGIPASGSYKIGDIVISDSQANGVFGWVCTQAGDPGRWEVIGSGAGGDEPNIGSISKEHLTSKLAGEIDNNTNSINSLTEIANSHTNLIDNLTTQIENVDFSEVEAKIGDLPTLQTNAKDSLVAAVNELFQNANNGKELIATAIGEPLNSSDTFSAMSNGINGLNASFKNALMNNGITVESADKFKQLIEKLSLLANSEGKGIQYATGNIIGGDKVSFSTGVGSATSTLTNSFTYGCTLEVNNLSFKPSIVLIIITDKISSNKQYAMYGIAYGFDLNYYIHQTLTDINSISQNFMNHPLGVDNVGTAYGETIYTPNLTDNGFYLYSTVTTDNVDYTYHAFGVGEEDTALRDSLASILQDEGVNVTSEDNLSNLITKTDNEFNNKNTKAENTRSTLANLMKNGGYNITGEEDIARLLELLTINGVKFDYYKYTCTDEYILDKMYPMPQAHEAIPSGVTDTWKYQSRWENQERPTAAEHSCGQSACPGAVQFQALGAWSNVYRVDGTTFTQNTGVEMRNIKVYGWYNGQWEEVQNVAIPNGNFYAESFSGDSNRYFADSIKQSENSKTIILREANKINGENCMYHPFSEIKNFSLKYEYVYTCIDLRKVKWDENGVDDRDSTHYCANCGGDWWLAEGLTFDSSWQHNQGIAQPKMVEITNDWQRFSMTTVPENWENGFPVQ
jgi:hypothetical protein